MKHKANDFQVFENINSANVVNFSVATTLKNRQDPSAIVFDIDPVSHLPTIAVDSKRLFLKCIGNQERKKLLRKLVWAVVIRGTRDEGGKTIGSDEGANEKVGASL